MSDDDYDPDCVIIQSPAAITSRAQAPQAARESKAEDSPACSNKPPCPAGSLSTRSRTSRKISEAGSFVASPLPGTSGGTWRGTRVPTARKGRKRAASSYGVYSYFTCSGNY